MKDFIIALVIICMVIAAVACNTAYTVRVFSDMENRLSAFPAEFQAADKDKTIADIISLRSEWDNKKKRIAVTVSREYIDNIGQALIRLESAVQNGSAYEYQAELRILTDALDDLRRAEAFSLSSFT